MREDRVGSREITTHGCPPGSEVDARSARWGIDLFIEDGAYTTLAAAVTILVVLVLTFSSVTAVWSMARAGDVQVSADSAALAGANVISSYYTAATVVDACIASLGFAGLIVSGAGLVTVFIPGARWSAPKVIKTGTDMLKARNSFAKTASKGLQALEKALPFLAGANGMRICSAQSGEQVSFTGVALPIPAKSASEFPALEGKEVDTDEIEEAHDDLEEAADELEEVREKTADAKERAWRADCGRVGRNMQERAASLTGLSAMENPDYTSSLTWKPQVGLDRARAYYRWRYENERPERDDAESCADSAARKAFYRYAYDRLAQARIDDGGDRVTSTVPLLPRNTAEVKRTTLYTDLVWPSTVEPEGLTIHYASDCPGATGDAARKVSLKDEDVGTVRECDVCKFSVGDVGRTPAASTSINNGFEYHLREFTLALNDYVDCRNDEIEAERRGRGRGGGRGRRLRDGAQYAQVGKAPHRAARPLRVPGARRVERHLHVRGARDLLFRWGRPGCSRCHLGGGARDRSGDVREQRAFEFLLVAQERIVGGRGRASARKRSGPLGKAAGGIRKPGRWAVVGHRRHAFEHGVGRRRAYRRSARWHDLGRRRDARFGTRGHEPAQAGAHGHCERARACGRRGSRFRSGASASGAPEQHRSR